MLEQFILYNLLPTIISGLLTWLFINFALKVLDIKYGWMRLSLLYLPMLKSVLVLLGVGMVMQWPREVFVYWQANALPYTTVLPGLMAWLGVGMMVRAYLENTTRNRALKNAVNAEEIAPRLTEAMAKVMDAYQLSDTKVVGNTITCTLPSKPAQAKLFVTEEAIGSPMVLTRDEGPQIIFPASLINVLNDDELEGALAHEYAHFLLDNPVWCSSDGIRHLAPASPISMLLSLQLAREEEMACDDMAISILDNPRGYVDMLMKSYRYALEGKTSMDKRLQSLPHLLGGKPIFSERVERLAGKKFKESLSGWQYCYAGIVWLGVFTLFGFG